MSAACTCWGCGKAAAPGKQFHQCHTCKSAHRSSGFFCCKACQEEHRARHEVWHQEQADREMITKKHILARTKREVSAHAEAVAEGKKSGDEYERLVAVSTEAALKGDYARAARKARGAIAYDPTRTEAYNSLAVVLEASGELVNAARAYVVYMEIAVRRGEDQSEMFAMSASRAFVLLTREECAGEPRPSWWNETSLRSLSSLAVALTPTVISSWQMAGAVLTRQEYIVDVEWGHVSQKEEASDLREAARCFKEEAELEQFDEARKREIEQFGAECLKEAEILEGGLAASSDRSGAGTSASHARATTSERAEAEARPIGKSAVDRMLGRAGVSL
jgi:hypothetical protein